MSEIANLALESTFNNGLISLINEKRKESSQLSLINNEHEPLLKYIDLIIKYAVKTGDFGQYTSLNIVASELGDYMVSIITMYKNASLYNDKYKMNDIIKEAGEEIAGFINLLSQFIVCSEDIKLKRRLIIELADLFINKYSVSFFKNVVLDTYDIDNERVYWEKIKFKIQNIYEQNMKTVLKRREPSRLPWYKKLFINNVEEKKEVNVKDVIKKLCIIPKTDLLIQDKPTPPEEIYSEKEDKSSSKKNGPKILVRPKGHSNIARFQKRTKGY